MKKLLILLLFSASIISAEEVLVDQVKIIRQGDSTLSVSFMVDSHNLQIGTIPNSTPKAEIKELIASEIKRWREQCAETNVQDLIKTYEGKSFTLDVK